MVLMIVEWKKKGSALYIYLNRPEKKNAINLEMIAEIRRLISEASSMEDVRAIVITGSGQDFSAGADIEMLASFDSMSAFAFRMAMNGLSMDMRRSRKPVIALLKGYSLGGGLELSESADIRIALKDAVIGQPEVSIGINAGAGGNVILPRIVGSGRAMYMAMTGKKFSASEAREMGLVDEVVDSDEEAEKIVNEICSKPPSTLSYIKALVNASLDLPLDEAMQEEALYFSMLFNEKDTRDILARWRKRS